MSTNSTISIKRKDGTQTSIYGHWDGYIKGVGVTLQLAYNTAEKVEELLKLGDLSSLRYHTEPKEGKHSFDEPQSDVCIAYHRDRGEQFRQSGGRQQFNYIFDEDEAVWYCENEQHIDDTEAETILGLDYYYSCPKTLLLDEILKCDFTRWVADEYALNGGEVHSKCIEKALEARKDIIKKRQEAIDAFYRAYCD